MRMISMCLAIECSNNLRMSFLLALINDHRVSAGDKIADIIGPGPKQLRHAGSLHQNEHACILDGRGLGDCWVIVVYVLGSGATLGLADARGYRCCKTKATWSCVMERTGPQRPAEPQEALKHRGALKEVRGDAHHRKDMPPQPFHCLRHFPPLSTALALLPARVFSTLCPVLKDWVQQFWFAGDGCPAFAGLEPPALCLYSAQAWRRAGRRSLRPS